MSLVERRKELIGKKGKRVKNKEKEEKGEKEF